MMRSVSRAHLIRLAIIVVVLGAMLLVGERLSVAPINETTTATPSQTTTINEQILLDNLGQKKQDQIVSKSFVIRPGSSKLSYTQALSLYQNSILEFNEDCQLSSKNLSLSLNNEIMIDNRSPRPNTFSVGSASIVIGPYDFGFMILREKGTSVPVDCGIQKNVASLSIQ